MIQSPNRPFAVWVLAALAWAPLASAQSFAIVNATVVDGSGGEPYTGSVLVQEGRIAAAGPDVPIPPDVRRLDATGKTVLPGLFDLHTHSPYPAVAGLSGGWPKHLAAYLYSGVTSIVDFGLYPEMFEPMRRLLAEGAVQGPRVHMAARLAPPYGHGLEGGRGDYFTEAVFSPEDARAAMARLAPYRPDAIKVFTDGWRYGYAPPMADMAPGTIAAIVDEARPHGTPVMTHTVTLQGAKDAAAAGVNVLAHGIGDAAADAGLLELLEANRVFYVPTLVVYQPKGRELLGPILSAVLEPAARRLVSPPLTTPASAARLVPRYSDPDSPRARRWENLLTNNRILHEAGVPIGVGTDAGVTNTWHGWATLRELQLLVYAGMTPLEALTAATGRSAKAIGVESERGRIAPGLLADLVLVAGEPHKEIADIEKIDQVFLGGREIDRGKLAGLIADESEAALPARQVKPLLDDFELEGRQSRIGTRWVNSTEPGLHVTAMLFQRVWREAGNRCLAVHVRMSHHTRRWASVDLPLSPGAVEPVDLTEYRGVRFEARGDGDYRLLVSSAGVRDYDYHAAPFEAGAAWRTVSIPFAVLAQSRGGVPWTGADALTIMFRIEREAGESAWLELDNIELYR